MAEGLAARRCSIRGRSCHRGRRRTTLRPRNRHPTTARRLIRRPSNSHRPLSISSSVSSCCCSCDGTLPIARDVDGSRRCKVRLDCMGRSSHDQFRSRAHSIESDRAAASTHSCLCDGLFAVAPRHRPGLARWIYVVAVDVAQRLPTQVAIDVVQYFVLRESHRCDNRGAGVVADLHPVTDGEPRFEYCHVEPLTRRQAGADAKTSGGSESPCR
jgi:hypothetical protein